MVSGSDFAVVGAGIVGLFTAAALRDRGAQVTLYERGLPGEGMSGGESRIFRYVHRDPRLVGAAHRSSRLWREWEERSERELLRADGVVVLEADPQAHAAELRHAGVEARAVTGSEVHDWLPLLGEREGAALLDEAGGVIRARSAVRMLSELLQPCLVADEVLAVRPTRAGTVELRTAGTVREHGRVLVCAGRGTPALARGAGLQLPVRHSAHVRLTFELGRPAPEQLACLLDRGQAHDPGNAYGDPMPGNHAFAVGLARTHAAADGALREPEGLAEATQRTQSYVAAALPGLNAQPVEARHCWVTELPWGHDAFALWQSGSAMFLAGNNLFKHAPLIGLALAGYAVGEPPELRLEPDLRLGLAR